MTEFQRILLVKPSSLGDIIHALPALSALRGRFPRSRIAWLVKREWSDILRGHPDLTDVIAADLRWASFPRLIPELRRGGYDLVLDFQGLLRSAVMAWLTGASTRVGFAAGREGSRWWYSESVRLPESEGVPWRLIPMHAVERNLALAAHVGADIASPVFRFPDFTEEAERMQNVLAEAGVGPTEPVIAVAPVDRLRLRSWSLERFADVALRLLESGAGKILLLGTAGQRDIVRAFAEKLPTGLVDLVGRTTVRELAVVLRRARLLLANDSAPLHLAAAMGTPVVGLYGPTNVVRARPYGERHRVIRTELPCSPCEQKACSNKTQYECLTAISVNEVVTAAQEVLQGTSHRPGGCRS